MNAAPYPQPHDKEMADLCEAVYDLGKTTDGWIREKDFDDQESGFRAAIFRRENNDEYVLAFAGTDFSSYKDLETDALQAIGFSTKQFDQAAKTAAIFQKEYDQNGSKLSLAGHSLGGAQATVGSAVTGLPAVIINPAGVHDNTLIRNDINPQEFREKAEAGLIRNIIHQGEIVDWLNGRSPAGISSEIKSLASEKVGRAVTSALDTAANAAQAVTDAVEGPAQVVREVVKAVVESTEDAVNQAAGHVQATVKPVLTSAGNTISETTSTVSSSVKNAADTLGHAISDGADYMRETVKPVAAKIETAAIETAQAVNGAITPVIDALGRAAGDAADAVSTKARSGANSVRQTVSGAADDVAEKVTPIARKLEASAVEAADAVSGAVKTAADRTGDAVNIASGHVRAAVTPVIDRVGTVLNDVAQTASTYINNTADAVANTASDTMDKVVENVRPMAENVKNAIKDSASTVIDSTQSAVDAAGKTIQRAADGVRDRADKVSAWWNTPMPASYGLRIEVQDQSGASMAEKHKIGLTRETINTAINPQHKQAAMAKAFRENPAQAAQIYPELEGAHKALEAVKSAAGRVGPKTQHQAGIIIHRKLIKQIEQDKAIPTPQQAIRFTSNALNAAREQGR